MANINSVCSTICVKNPGKSRDFYVDTFGAKVLFDCGWYIMVGLGNSSLGFIAPQSDEQPVFAGGLTYNIEVEDVDAEYERLSPMGLVEAMPLEDHPWGDRGFCLVEPNDGVLIYVYTSIEPAEEFKPYFKD